MANSVDLSEREIEILKLVATGVSNKEIAQKLNISANTVKVHLRNIFTKIEVVSRTEATLYAIEHHIIDSPGNNNKSTVPEKKFFDKHRNSIIASITVLLLFMILGLSRFFQPRQQTPATPQATVIEATQTPRWVDFAALPEGRAGMAVVLFEGQIYIFGGETATGITGTSLQYNLTANKWSPISEKPTPVTEVQAVIVGEKIFIPGGWTGKEVVSSLEVYNPRTDSWEESLPLPHPRSGYGLAALEGQIFLFGGWDGNKVTDSVYSYDPTTNTWTERNPLPSAEALMGVSVIKGRIYLIGGWDGQKSLNSNYMYIPNREDIAEQAWYSMSALPVPICEPAIADILDLIYITTDPGCSMGGNSVVNNDASSSYNNYQYSPYSDTWTRIEQYPFKMGDRAVIVPFNTDFYIMGGVENNIFSTRNIGYEVIFITSLPYVEQ
jgi:DNA-binding CsgD family transcriptional regulator/N-acetylneuraminic acid mutarotase